MGSKGSARRKDRRPLPKVRTRLYPNLVIGWHEGPVQAGPLTKTQRRQRKEVGLSLLVCAGAFAIAFGLYLLLG